MIIITALYNIEEAVDIMMLYSFYFLSAFFLVSSSFWLLELIYIYTDRLSNTNRKMISHLIISKVMFIEFIMLIHCSELVSNSNMVSPIIWQTMVRISETMISLFERSKNYRFTRKRMKISETTIMPKKIILRMRVKPKTDVMKFPSEDWEPMIIII